MPEEIIREEVPIVAPLVALDYITVTKAAGWWLAVVLAEARGKKQIGTYLWQKKQDGKWHRKQKFTVHNPKKWPVIREAIEKFLPQLEAQAAEEKKKREAEKAASDT